jgi:hypothetical protein
METAGRPRALVRVPAGARPVSALGRRLGCSTGKRQLIAGDRMRALWEHQRPGDRRVNILDVKELFYAMKDQS